MFPSVCITCYTALHCNSLHWHGMQGERTQRRRSTRTGKRTHPEAAVPAPSDEPSKRGDRKRVRIGVVNGQSGQHVIAALRRLEGIPGRPPPGTLLLAQDPRSLNRCIISIHMSVLCALSSLSGFLRDKLHHAVRSQGQMHVCRASVSVW